MQRLENRGLSDYAGAVIIAALVGAALGVGQWLIFSRRFQQSAWWVAASTIGFAVGTVMDEMISVTVTSRRSVPEPNASHSWRDEGLAFRWLQPNAENLQANLCLASCVRMQPKPQQVQVAPQRVIQSGYSLNQPNEEEWHVELRNEHELDLLKYGANPDETLVIQGTLVQLPKIKTSAELVDLLRKGEVEDTPAERFLILKHDVQADSSRPTECALSHMVVEDKAALTESGKSSSMIMESLSLLCAHPKNKRVAVSLSYSDRYHTGQADPRFFEKATNLLRNLEFTDF